LLFGTFPIPGLTCPAPPFFPPTWSPVGTGIPLPVPTSFGKPLGTPVANPWVAGVGIRLPVPTAPFVSPTTFPFPVPAFGFGKGFPAAPVANPVGIPFFPGVPAIFGVPTC
jgi:hypothetical protein